jgi:isopenicillin N synthase-like dioxygenase
MCNLKTVDCQSTVKEESMSTTEAREVVERLPVIDIGPLMAGEAERHAVAAQLGQACRDCGFFYVVGHGVSEELAARLEHLSRAFFRQDTAEKMRLRMALGGRAWRGYFPVGGELTSGKPDQKEGLYFGAELPDDDPRVRAGLPLHGRNLFPEIPQFRETVLAYLNALTQVGHRLMAGLALSLGLDESYFADRYTRDPLILFRIFNYPRPALPAGSVEFWGVGEHTDYGLLTILGQDDVGGLEVKTGTGWVAAPPIPGSFVCNIGDMLDRMTGGLYRSTPHRVRASTGRDRLSLPFFFDPNFAAEVRPIEGLEGIPAGEDRHRRWDQASVHEFRGTYGDYLLNKVAKVFPELRRDVL